MYPAKTRHLFQPLEVMLNYAQVKWHMRSYGQKQQNGLSQIDIGQKSNSIWSRHLKNFPHVAHPEICCVR